MDILQVLENKIHSLLLLIKKLKEHNEHLTHENVQLAAQIESMKNNMLKENHDIGELHKERELTKMVVDELIKNIDSLVEKEHVK